MIARSCSVWDRAAGSVSDRFLSPISLCGGPGPREARGAHQIVRDDTQTDPAVHAVFAMVATAIESVSTFEHTDAGLQSRRAIVARDGTSVGVQTHVARA